ncbi:helix-hairpin-helix domain-containing protein [Telmatocola sphagniphila]|uniref:Helix-hairpin-helix domain-containing protein n=1 Tax=Telmatocola sphagniphila TaxID=1123043 RepID=A0A8E6EZA6_9BACT|nr:helix-hairpin-helix domain-containing protein [Telmatocola sphagniphila]QVL33251.1 helix-hairpin-helix domain-containing protein [Telmatocola sphagniphila]
MKRANKSSSRSNVNKFEDIPNIGVSLAADLRQLGYKQPSDLAGEDPYQMYYSLCKITNEKQDPCVLDTFIAAVRYMDGGPKTPWWKFTSERKRTLAALNAAKKESAK